MTAIFVRIDRCADRRRRLGGIATALIGVSLLVSAVGPVTLVTDAHDRSETRGLQRDGSWMTAREVEVCLHDARRVGRLVRVHAGSDADWPRQVRPTRG